MHATAIKTDAPSLAHLVFSILQASYFVVIVFLQCPGELFLEKRLVLRGRLRYTPRSLLTFLLLLLLFFEPIFKALNFFIFIIVVMEFVRA